MHSVQQILERALADAIEDTLGPSHSPYAQVRRCADGRFGDYQCNTLIALAKQLGTNPRTLAEEVAEELATYVEEISEPPEVAGAGYINFRLKPAFLATHLAEAIAHQHLGVPSTATPHTIVLDFSSPNIAKPMHVGHIRSTILGDALARILRFVGHQVITDNHLGDWGTQFGYLIVGWKKHRDDLELTREPLAECERLYKLVYAQAEANPAVKNEARAELANLQAGDPENLAIWNRIRETSLAAFEKIYVRLGVKFDHSHGESFYNPRLSALVKNLRESGLAQESDGAVCIFSDGKLPPKDDPFLINKDGEWKPNPFIIQKADGAFLYATTDLATLQYRMETWNSQDILYLTDARQKLHFRQLFAAAARWNITGNTRLHHITFGSILGGAGKPLATRDGEPPKLAELLDEAESRALAIVEEKNPELPENRKRQIARVVGLGALKYADLSSNRTTDYSFSWEKMLAMSGNTAPYLQYTYVRISSIFRKGETTSVANIDLAHPAELDLAKHLLRFPEAIYVVLEEYRPHHLCSYLYELATKFATFYEACPVLKSSEPARSTRLALCQLTAAIMKQGLDLLGIETIEQM